ncbi:DNA adenine methylase [Acinetobacter baumannii]|uniref:DNA adenine methylase n=1 Tax=Acinetobacter baumannii TaxID=470 RepID=UPI0023420635|nr:DNA adenine methylase [Acinetobacter baumannii]
MSQAINSPFRYAGGKFYARKLILEHIPHHTCYIEPFVGGGSIFFAKDKVEKNILNDADPDLINTYLIIRDRVDELVAALDGEEALKERHSWYKNEFKPQNDLERAVRWYYLNRTSYSGIMNPKNCYWGYGDKYSMRPENWGRSLVKTSAKLQDVEFTNYDFEQVIDSAPDDAFLFVDPPYFNADQDKFYTFSFKKEDHYRLEQCLLRNKDRLNFLITYDNSPEIRKLYSWANAMLDKEWNYTINRTDDQTKNKNQAPEKAARYKGKEVFITNYAVQEPDGATNLELVFDEI